MLSAHEFTVGSLGDAKPLSLVLPRGSYEAVVLIGGLPGTPAAVFLSGEFKFRYFEISGEQNWGGLLIPNVRIEMDETTLFDPQSSTPGLGAVVRTGTQLVVRAKAESSFGRSSKVILEDGLPSTNELEAGFGRWQIVIGEGRDRRVLVVVDTNQGGGT